MEWRKKPVVVEAVQVKDTLFIGTVAWHRGENFSEQPEWLLKAIEGGDVGLTGMGIRIYTMEGNVYAKAGDFLIRGVKGELYPCNPEVFAATYEPATPASPESGGE